MSEGRPVRNPNQHESTYGTIMEELGKIQALTLNPNLKSRPEIERSVCLNGRLE